MSQAEREALKLDLEILIQLLDFHAQNEEIWVGRKQEFEQHINDILDKINEIKRKLEQ